MTMYRINPGENKMELFRSSKFTEYHYETELEHWLEQNLHVLTDDDPLLPIGRQLSTSTSGTVDLLALDANGNLLVIELKRGKTPRDAIAQILEYAAWAAAQSHEDILGHAERYLHPHTLAQRWAETFTSYDSADADDPATGLPTHIRLNERQRLLLVVEGYSERITAVARYLRKSGLDFTLVTFRYYRLDSGEEMLDFETSVGPDQDSVATAGGPAPQNAPSEEAIVATWSPPVQAAYQVFRERVLQSEPNLLYLRTTQQAVTFRMQVPDQKRGAYICTFEPDRGPGKRATVAIRKPSLEGFLNVDAIVGNIAAGVPDGATTSGGKKWATIWFAPQAQLAAQVADLITRYVVEPLAAQQPGNDEEIGVTAHGGIEPQVT